MNRLRPTPTVLTLCLGLVALTACGSDETTASPPATDTIDEAPDPIESTLDAGDTSTTATDDDTSDDTTSGTASATATDDTTGADAEPDGDSTFEIDVWADNWMAVYVDGQLIGEDSVPITTERSFNAETFTFEASLPFTIAIEAKDFKETDSGIEYIGAQNQQMGDGGLIAQVTDLTTGEVIAVTDAGWSTLVVHQAPLNPECERDVDPDATCEFAIIETPDDWASADFDDSSWTAASVWTAADVDPKDGYDELSWDPDAQLVWGSDLEIDNTVLLRTTVG